MRLWTIHPKYLDQKGLVAVWREGLLAKKVLEGKTKGYKYHPQLKRFQECDDSMIAINQYLNEIYNEGEKRGYRFDKSKIEIKNTRNNEKIEVTRKQIQYEFELLKSKISKRDNDKYMKIKDIKEIEINELFTLKEGEIGSWEKEKREIIEIMKETD
jgi:hypothetical protein